MGLTWHCIPILWWQGRWSVSLATLGDRWCVLVPWLCDYQHQATQPPGTAIHIHVYTHHGSGLCWCSTLHTADGHRDLPEHSECDQNQCWSFRDTSPRAASRLQAADCVQEQSKTLAATWALLSPYTGLQTTLQLVLTTRISIPFLQSTTHIQKLLFGLHICAPKYHCQYTTN